MCGEGLTCQHFYFQVVSIVGLAYLTFKQREKHFRSLKPLVFQKSFIMGPQPSVHLVSTHALNTLRINLSPFTKDFRVWGALFEKYRIYLGSVLGQFTRQ